MDSVASIADLATHDLARLREQGEHGVIVVGSSIGGWVALEMALQAAADDRSAGAVGAVVDMNGQVRSSKASQVPTSWPSTRAGSPKRRGMTPSVATGTRLH